MEPTERDSVGDKIDWDKVGRIYKPESAIDHIVQKEMTRLKLAFDSQIDTQDASLEEKLKNPAGKGKK